MAREAPEVRLIRETLERVMLPATASAVFFEALQRSGAALPQNADDCLTLVKGALRTTLADRVGDDEASYITDQLVMMLSSLSTQNERRPRKSASRHDMPTAAIHVSDDAKPVFVISKTRDFVDKLRVALGPSSVTAIFVPDLPTLEARLSMLSPALVLIDAVSLPNIEPARLVELLKPLPAQTIKALWGADVAYGLRLTEEAERHGVSLTSFDRAEGIAPLMDVIRSRSGG